MTVSDALYSLYNGSPVNAERVARKTGAKSPEKLDEAARKDGWVRVYLTENGSLITLHYTTPWNRRMMFRQHRIIGMHKNAPIFHVTKAKE